MTRISDRLFLEMFNKLDEIGKRKVIDLLLELQGVKEKVDSGNLAITTYKKKSDR